MASCGFFWDLGKKKELLKEYHGKTTQNYWNHHNHGTNGLSRKCTESFQIDELAGNASIQLGKTRTVQPQTGLYKVTKDRQKTEYQSESHEE